MNELPECPNGCGIMHPHYDNVGIPYEQGGVPKIEVDYYYCPICTATDEDMEDIDEYDIPSDS
jgi:hypothetical protein